ncbi:MAG: MBL fold metallo-hydrolase [Kiritimatiellae bacterium]|nr:MBL fold metallo-hydrolase [Kiritimatiellia bacterium]
MKLTFIGTGAADWDWKNFPPGTRGSTATLIGASCLIDAGPSVLRGLAAAHVSPARINDLLITHSHSDHFNKEAILEIAAASRRRSLRVWAPPQALAALAAVVPDGAVEAHPVLPGDNFRIGTLRVVALPANHATSKKDEQTLNFAFSGGGVRLLYALDGAWFCTWARLFLKRFLDGAPLTAIIWDATCGATFNDWRFSEHNDLKMISAMREAMLKDGLVSPDAVHVFDHLARTLWPASQAAQQRLADRFKGILAQDGLVLTLNPIKKAKQ